ncbi:ABC transporter ATP-binding protein [Candidatus Pacearchaeota archaeon]|nr:ABC transporter ATP-binding protein [Candidatus Pacearchaeota archaeon]
MIELVNVSKKLGGRKILDNVSLKFGGNDVVGVLGPNGAGKSVLLKTIAGFLKPDKGKIYSKGEIGISIQDNSFYESLTVEQNLYYFARIYRIKEKKKKINELLKELGLEKFVKSGANTLSGGTKKKLDLACSLLNSPSTIILDEPFTGLDKMFVDELNTLLKTIHSLGVTIIISSHIIPSMIDICNRFILVQDGEIKEVSREEVKRFL